MKEFRGKLTRFSRSRGHMVPTNEYLDWINGTEEAEMSIRDPFGGYDQWKTASPYDDEIEDNEAIESAFSDFAGPYDLYRQTYKATACGPTVGFTVWGEFGPGDNGESGPASTYEPPHNRTFYGDDLRKLGTWKDLADAGILVTEILVSSIVEGVEETTETLGTDCSGLNLDPDEIKKSFFNNVEEINRQADAIWHGTHGCDECARHWRELGLELHPTYMDEMTGCDGITIVWDDCPECSGDGATI